jgi:hypothetical protein
MSIFQSSRSISPRAVGGVRLAIGLGQGIAFYGLHLAHKHEVWPANDPVLFGALLGAVWFAPFVWMAGLGALRRGTLLVWVISAAGLAAALASYAAWKEADVGGRPAFETPMAMVTFLAIGAILFIGHHLIAPADEARKPIASYPSYFDTAWKHAVQLALALGFLGAFWVVLHLGAGLFWLIGIKALEIRVIRMPWFFMPVSGLVFAGGVHLADVRAGMTRGLRTIGLTLLSWLMPLMGVLAAAFIVALPFTGLDALWKVGHATALLLTAATALIVLLNAAYQDGSVETRAPRALQWIGRATAIVLVPLIGLAAWGLGIRVAQHGFTPDRIVALGWLVGAAVYAVGYALAAVRKGPWLRGLERTNIIAAFVDLAILIALFTPIADPQRISAADQTWRLVQGRAPVETFDYRFLRFDAGRWGRKALDELAKGGKGPKAAEIAKRAQHALELQNRWDGELATAPPKLASAIDMRPAGARLPESFVRQFEAKPDPGNGLPSCTEEKHCTGYVMDLGPEDRSDVLIAWPTGNVGVYRQDAQGVWQVRGSFQTAGCQATADHLAKGEAHALAPELSDLELGGRRFQLQAAGACGEAIPAKH